MMQRALYTAFVLLVIATVNEAAGQIGTGSPSSDSLRVDYERGYELVEAGEYEESIEYLARVVNADVAYEDGEAVYWYGRAIEASDRPGVALTVWKEGIDVLERPSLRLLDAFVRAAFTYEQENYYEAASEQYLEILKHLDQEIGGEDEAVLHQHLDELCLILTDELEENVGLAGCEEETPYTEITSQEVEELITWWNSENAHFATPRNERLEEHLSRIAYAYEHYSHEGELDDRGRVYIRFGPPERSTTVRFDDLRGLHRNPGLASLVGQGFDGSRNEFWLYPGVERAAHFLFIYDRDEGYSLAEANELIPPGLRGSQRRAEQAVAVMEHVYRQLSLYHIDYATTYNEVASYLDRMAFARMGSERLPTPPSSFVQTTLGRARNEDYQIDRRRTNRIPDAATNLHRNLERVDLSVRSARFLEEDGTTRMEVYWGASLDELYPNRRTRRALRREDIRDLSEGYVLQGTLVTLDEAYVHEQLLRHHHRVGPLEGEVEEGDFEPLTYALRFDRPVHRFGVQWDQFQVYEDEESEEPQLGPQIKVHQFVVDSLQPLSDDPSQLEMSDLKPLWLTDDSTFVAGGDDSDEVVYPHADITPETELALYFEVYHLESGEDGQRRFSVEYEIDRVALVDLRRVLRGDVQERTSVRTDYEQEEATAAEHIVLDLVEEEDFVGEVTITLRVRDEVSGQEVERELLFSVIDPRRPERHW